MLLVIGLVLAGSLYVNSTTFKQFQQQSTDDKMIAKSLIPIYENSKLISYYDTIQNKTIPAQEIKSYLKVRG